MVGAALDVESQLSNRAPSISTQFVLCALAMLEGADNQLLGASLKTTGQELKFTLDSLAVMSLAQGVAANAACPFWGVMADRGIMRQKDLMMIAALGQGAITILLALATQYGNYMIFLRAMNGLFLAGLRPLANGVVAKTTSGNLQGKIFARILIFMNLGGSICSFVVTPMAAIPFEFMGLEFNGWRPAWIMVGLLSLAVSALTAAFMEEAPAKRTRPEQSMVAAVKDEMGLFWSFLTIPTFGIMVIQGIFGSLPWTVLWMATRYYQIGGSMSDPTVGLLVGLSPVSAMVGTLLGGWISDTAQMKFGAHGRPLIAQVSIITAVPFLFLTFYGIPPEYGGFWIYLALFSMFGLLGQWPLAGCNWPVLSQIVPEDIRSRVLAVEGALENTLANMAGPFALATAGRMLGFDLQEIDPSGTDLPAARLLGTALMICTCTPYLLTFVFYSCLHFTFPRDLRKMVEKQGNPPAESKGALSSSHLLGKGYSAGHL